MAEEKQHSREYWIVNKVLRRITCRPFRFRLRVDEGGFYITVFRGAGISLHQGHPRFDPKFVPNQSSSLTQEEKKDAQHVVRSTINKAAGREFIKAKFGKFLPSSQIAYLSAIRADHKLDEHSSLIEMFEESENIAGEVTQESPLLQGDEEKQLLPVATNAVEQRKSRGIGDEEQVFHCIAWTHEDLLRYFLLCPEVVTFDVTSHTNASGYHHLSLAFHAELASTSKYSSAVFGFQTNGVYHSGTYSKKHSPGFFQNMSLPE
eukprot:scaffold9529_cov80-Skeletonema_menzelii.AAC.1